MYKFKIDSLNCMSCFHNIEDSLKEFDKSIDANVDIRNQILTVNSSRTAEEIVKVIEEAGYPVSGVSRS